MSFIDMTTYRQALSRAGELVDHVTLREAIFGVYELWFNDKINGRRVVFHSYFGMSLFDLGVEDMFEQEQYRKALGAYFNPRAVRKLAFMRGAQPKSVLQVPQNKVEFANTVRVRIYISEAVSLEFQTTRKTGPLKWKHVEEKFKIIRFGDGFVSDENYRHARQQALQVLNSVRDRSVKVVRRRSGKRI